MPTKKLKTELQYTKKKLDENFKTLEDRPEHSKKSNKRRKKAKRDSISCGRMFGD
jgi:hypothetical protein